MFVTSKMLSDSNTIITIDLAYPRNYSPTMKNRVTLIYV